MSQIRGTYSTAEIIVFMVAMLVAGVVSTLIIYRGIIIPLRINDAQDDAIRATHKYIYRQEMYRTKKPLDTANYIYFRNKYLECIK